MITTTTPTAQTPRPYGRPAHRRPRRPAVMARHLLRVLRDPFRVRRLRQELALLKAEDSELTAYARATVRAWQQRQPEPCLILVGLLEERGQMPPSGMTVVALLSQGYRAGGAR